MVNLPPLSDEVFQYGARKTKLVEPVMRKSVEYRIIIDTNFLFLLNMQKYTISGSGQRLLER